MGNYISADNVASILSTVNRIHFEDMQRASVLATASSSNSIILNTLPENEQQCVIRGTISANEESSLLNHILEQNRMQSVFIVVYGKNCNDDSIFNKYVQLRKLGFTSISLYVGGLFEWLLLQDIYGAENFPTTCGAVVPYTSSNNTNRMSHGYAGKNTTSIVTDPLSYGLSTSKSKGGKESKGSFEFNR